MSGISPKERDALIEQARQNTTEEPVERNLPSKTKMAKNLAKAAVKHVANGMKKVGVEEYQRRLNICNNCPDDMRVKNRCTHEDCGCFLDKKAWWDSETCPNEHWDINGV